MNLALIKDGLLLMVIGMGTVFSFLTLMVLVITGSSKLAQTYTHLLPDLAPKPARKPKKPAVPAPQPAAPVAEDDTDVLAAISAAIHRYRSDRR